MKNILKRLLSSVLCLAMLLPMLPASVLAANDTPDKLELTDGYLKVSVSGKNGGFLIDTGPAHQIAAVDSVHFPLWRYDPRMAAQGKTGLTLDSKDKSDTVSFSANALSKDLGENRFRQLVKMVGADEAKALLDKAEAGFKENYKLLTELAALPTL